jgi:uncharacterized membrane protein YhaH (DUF805 family)
MQSLFSFSGRLNRAKFWLILIATDIVLFAVFGVLVAMGGGSMSDDFVAAGGRWVPTMGGGIVGGIVAFVVWVAAVWIGLATGVKRFHDRGKTGWWVLIVLVPVIGGLWYLIECGFLRGTVGPNAYGHDPLTALS